MEATTDERQKNSPSASGSNHNFHRGAPSYLALRLYISFFLQAFEGNHVQGHFVTQGFYAEELRNPHICPDAGAEFPQIPF
jgi:hypothetical protein